MVFLAFSIKDLDEKGNEIKEEKKTKTTKKTKTEDKTVAV